MTPRLPAARIRPHSAAFRPAHELVEAGGSCVLCGYDRSVRALHFHHVDPSQKAFGLAFAGVARSLERCREEAAKCLLLCSNCHAEVEDGLATIPNVGPGAHSGPFGRG